MNYLPITIEGSIMLQQRIEYSGSNAEYIGYANPGVAETDNEWLIVKLTYDSSNLMTKKVFADGSKAFDKSWQDRAGYSYA